MSTEKGKGISTVLCGISTALMIICDLVAPIGMFIWLGAATEMNQDTEVIDSMIVTVLCCGAGLIASLILAVIAKIKNRKSKWAVICIVLSSVFFVTGLIAALFFVWVASQYHYYT